MGDDTGGWAEWMVEKYEALNIFSINRMPWDED